MIEVTIFKNQKQEYVSFEVTGHAGFADSGQDIVCASVSMLVINTVNAIERFTEDELITSADEETGSLQGHFQQRPSNEATLLLDAMILGLESIEADQNYNKYIDITFEEV